MTNDHTIRPKPPALLPHACYNLKLKVLSNRTTLVLSDTRELDRVPKTK